MPPDLTDKVELTTITQDHIDEIMAIEAASFSHPWSRRLFVAELNNASGLALGALWGKRQGFLAAYLFLWLVADEAQVHTVAVHPALRGKGLASYILLAGFDLAREKGATWASLEVRAANRAAQKLYEKLGFSVVGRRPGYYQNPLEDAVLMNCDI